MWLPSVPELTLRGARYVCTRTCAFFVQAGGTAWSRFETVVLVGVPVCRLIYITRYTSTDMNAFRKRVKN